MEATQRTKTGTIDRIRPNKPVACTRPFNKSTEQPDLRYTANSVITVGGSPPFLHKKWPLKKQPSKPTKYRFTKKRSRMRTRYGLIDKAIKDLCSPVLVMEGSEMKKYVLGEPPKFTMSAIAAQLKCAKVVGLKATHVLVPVALQKDSAAEESKYVQLAIDHLYGVLSPAQAKAVERKLERSASFRELYQGQIALKALYGTTTPEAHRAQLTEQRQAIMGKVSERLKEKLGVDLLALLKEQCKGLLPQEPGKKGRGAT